MSVLKMFMLWQERQVDPRHLKCSIEVMAYSKDAEGTSKGLVLMCRAEGCTAIGFILRKPGGVLAYHI